jgi:hypothetical protein
MMAGHSTIEVAPPQKLCEMFIRRYVMVLENTPLSLAATRLVIWGRDCLSYNELVMTRVARNGIARGVGDVNTLAFRNVQHANFFAVDADCVGLTRAIPWERNKQWLDLLSRNGTPLFAAVAPDAVAAEQRKGLREAFARAAITQPIAERLDWLETTTPERWRIGGETIRYDWYGSKGMEISTSHRQNPE